MKRYVRRRPRYKQWDCSDSSTFFEVEVSGTALVKHFSRSCRCSALVPLDCCDVCGQLAPIAQKGETKSPNASSKNTISNPSSVDTFPEQKTYNSGYSLVVTHLTTNPPVRCLNRAERTGSLVFNVLWSYVEGCGHSAVNEA